MSILAVGTHEAEALPVVVAFTINNERVESAAATSTLSSEATTIPSVVVTLITRTIPASTFSTSMVLLLLSLLQLICVMMVTVCRRCRIWVRMDIDWWDRLTTTAQVEVSR